jgi:hypothetical protein
MRFTVLLSGSLLPLIVSTSSSQYVFSNPPSSHHDSLAIPTSYESAIQARRILHLTPLGTLSTVFPSTKSSPHGAEHRPSTVQGIPIGMMDYFADCEETGDPTILAINIATSFKNVAAGSNISLSLQWTPPYPPSSRIESESFFSFLTPKKHNDNEPTPAPYSAANVPRFSLLGYLEVIPEEEVETLNLKKCFTDVHPDSKYWLPGNRIHKSEWTRLVVQEVYWVGGFGDRAYIGWIPVDEWKNVTRGEWEAIRLPGEKKGWKEWSVDL